MELSEYEHERRSDRQMYVKIYCERCKIEKWVRWDRVQKGQGRFCGRVCANAQQKEDGLKIRGMDFAHYVYDAARDESYAHWKDTEGVQHSTTYARWLWRRVNGEIPEGLRFRWKDGNPQNAVIENVEIVTSEMYSRESSERQRGKVISEETKKKMSEARQGMTLSAIHKENIGKATKKMWEEGVFDTPEIREAYSRQGKATIGSKRTEEQKKKMSEARKDFRLPASAFLPEAREKQRRKLIGRIQSEESNLKRSLALKGRKFSDEHLKKLSISVRKRVANRTHNWYQGGSTTDPYPTEFGPYLKRMIRRRDNHKCQSCGTNVYRSSLGHVHHINGNKQDCSENNLLLLCATCHNAVHSRNTITSSKIGELKAKLVY